MHPSCHLNSGTCHCVHLLRPCVPRPRACPAPLPACLCSTYSPLRYYGLVSWGTLGYTWFLTVVFVCQFLPCQRPRGGPTAPGQAVFHAPPWGLLGNGGPASPTVQGACKPPWLLGMGPLGFSPALHTVRGSSGARASTLTPKQRQQRSPLLNPNPNPKTPRLGAGQAGHEGGGGGAGRPGPHGGQVPQGVRRRGKWVVGCLSLRLALLPLSAPRLPLGFRHSVAAPRPSELG